MKLGLLKDLYVDELKDLNGGVRTYAMLLGHTEAAELLQTTLDEEGAADKALIELAETSINIGANEANGSALAEAPKPGRASSAVHQQTACAVEEVWRSEWNPN